MGALDHVQLHRVSCTEDVLFFLRWLGNMRSHLAIDSETGGLEWYKQPLRTVQLGDTNDGWCFVWDDWKGLLRDVLERYDGRYVFHNAKFDIHFLEHNGVTWSEDMWRRTHDTRLIAHHLDPASSTALKNLATRYVDAHAAIGQGVLQQAMKKNRWGWADIPLDYPGYWAYAAMDPVLTAHLRDTLHTTPLYELEREAQCVTYGMECRGVMVDVSHCHTKIAELQSFAHESIEWARERYNVDITKTQQLADRFIELRINLSEMTPTGKYKMDKAVISGIDHPLAEVALSTRKALKIVGTYLENFVEMQTRGILHPDVNVLGARTGRESVSRPALQTLTRGKGPVRDAFISRHHRDGRLILIDYDQIEMRLLAGLSGDPALGAAFDTGDFFTAMTQRIFNDPTIDKLDPRRQYVKNGAYARNYGAGVEKIATTNGTPIEDEQEREQLWKEMYPQAAAFPGLVTRTAMQRMFDDGVPWVQTPQGRRQVCGKNEMYVLVNYLIQGTAADVLKQTKVRLAEAGLDEFMMLAIHDEIMFDVPLDQVEEVKRLAMKIMTVPAEEYGVTLTVGADVVSRWGDKYAHESTGELEEEGVLSE